MFEDVSRREDFEDKCHGKDLDEVSAGQLMTCKTYHKEVCHLRTTDSRTTSNGAEHQKHHEKETNATRDDLRWYTD